MRKSTHILVPILVLCLLGGTMVIMLNKILSSTPPEAVGSCNGSIPSGCTVFTVSKDDQVQFAGARRVAVIISAGADGELVSTRKPPGPAQTWELRASQRLPCRW